MTSKVAKKTWNIFHAKRKTFKKKILEVILFDIL